MAIKFLEVSAEEAVLELTNLIVEGYEIKIGMDSEYKQTKQEKGGIDNSAVIECCHKWEKIAVEWLNRTLQVLENIYTSKRNMYEFREAQPRQLGLISAGDRNEWYNTSRAMGAKLDKLNEFDDFIKREFHVDIKFIAGNNIEHNGTGDLVVTPEK